MKQVIVVTALMIGGIFVWLLGSRLSSDALGMAIGLTFGLLAAIGIVLLVLAGQHRPVHYTTYTDNRSVTIVSGAQGMPLIADRQREITAQQQLARRAEWSEE